MIRGEIDSVETASPNISVEQQKLIFPKVFSDGKLILKTKLIALGK